MNGSEDAVSRDPAGSGPTRDDVAAPSDGHNGRAQPGRPVAPALARGGADARSSSPPALTLPFRGPRGGRAPAAAEPSDQIAVDHADRPDADTDGIAPPPPDDTANRDPSTASDASAPSADTDELTPPTANQADADEADAGDADPADEPGEADEADADGSGEADDADDADEAGDADPANEPGEADEADADGSGEADDADDADDADEAGDADPANEPGEADEADADGSQADASTADGADRTRADETVADEPPADLTAGAPTDDTDQDDTDEIAPVPPDDTDDPEPPTDLTAGAPTDDTDRDDTDRDDTDEIAPPTTDQPDDTTAPSALATGPEIRATPPTSPDEPQLPREPSTPDTEPDGPPDTEPGRPPDTEPGRTPHADPDGAQAPARASGAWARVWSVVSLALVAVAGSLPILWVVGAVPWRNPTLLIESMFRGFTACALDGGRLTPIEMLCPRAGVPLGMYQLDGGLSYPLGGLLVRAGVDPLDAWKLSVAALIVAGTAGLYWLLRRLTGSPLVALVFVAAYGLGGTLTGRSWNWYWNITAAALLPLVLASVYALYANAPQRRLRVMVLPGLGLLLSTLAVSIEWQYAGLFAAAAGAGAMVLLVLQWGGWRWWQRLVLLLASGAGLAAIVALLRWRLALAGITEQFDETIKTAGRFSIDVASFVVPDGSMSWIGKALARNGWNGRLVRSMVDGNQLWVAPYIGVLVLGLLLLVLVFRRFRLRPTPGRPRGFLLFLVLVTVAGVVLALGPVIRVAPLTQPTSAVDSPVGFLYATSPLQWIRYPWTWGYLLHVTLLVLYATLAVALLRTGPRRWSPLVLLLVVALAFDFVSPQVLSAANDPEPSIALAPDWVTVDSNDPAAVRFAAVAVPELEGALRRIDGPVMMLPWGNTWIIPSLGPDVGVRVRNVGIDRNVRQVVAASPFGYDELKRPTFETVRAMLDSGWVSAVVLLDHIPTADSIVRFDHGHLTPRDHRWQMWVRNRERDLFAAGYCLDSHSWFTVITSCGAGEPGDERAVATDRAR